MSKDFGQLGLHEWLVKASHEMGFRSPTPVQENCIPPILQGKDCIASAETGSGKTAAFALPILHKLSEDPFGIFALIITPTRELAVQIAQQVRALGSPIGLRVSVVIGGVDMTQQSLELGRKPHIVIATPGRLLNHLQATDTLKFNRLKFLVFDEADRLFGDQAAETEEILKFVPATSAGRQTLLFSATLAPYTLPAKEGAKEAPFTFHQSSQLYTVAKALDQKYMLMPVNVKHCYLAYLLSQFENNSIIIFTATCKFAALLTLTLKKLKFKAVAMHSLLTQEQRETSLERFRSQYVQILVATDVAARGLDIPQVELVVNYDIPASSEDYVHRIGRTGRAGKKGQAISLVTQYDIDRFKAIENVIDKNMEEYEANENQVLEHLPKATKALKLSEVLLEESDIAERIENKKKKAKSRQTSADSNQSAAEELAKQQNRVQKRKRQSSQGPSTPKKKRKQ